MTQSPEHSPPIRWWHIPLGLFTGLGALAFTLAGLLTAAFNLLGEEGAFQPESFRVTTTWVTLHLVAEILSGLAGGCVARLVGGRWAVWSLAGLLFVLGSLGAWEKIRQEDQGLVRQPGGITSLDASDVAISPDWKHAITPFSLGGTAFVAGWVVSRKIKQTSALPESSGQTEPAGL